MFVVIEVDVEVTCKAGKGMREVDVEEIIWVFLDSRVEGVRVRVEHSVGLVALDAVKCGRYWFICSCHLGVNRVYLGDHRMC